MPRRRIPAAPAIAALVLGLLLPACGDAPADPLPTTRVEPSLDWIRPGTRTDAVGGATRIETHAVQTGGVLPEGPAFGLDLAGGSAPLAPVRLAPPAIDAALERDLDALVDRWYVHARDASKGRLAAADTKISVHVRDLETGATLADLRGDRLMRPASNLKLVTSAAALVLLGPDGTYETTLHGGAVSGGVLTGDLVVRAGGDPLVRDGSLGAVEALLDPLVDQLRVSGVARVAGDLVLDEADFLEPGVGPSWPSADQHWQDYCALAAGLTVNGGVLETRVTAGAAGREARVELHPTPHGLDSNVGVSTVAGDANDVRVGATARRATVTGRIGTRTGTVESAFRHPDPVGLFGAVLQDRLARGGVALDGGVRRERGAAQGLPVLARLRSPVAHGLVPINTHSHNGVADQLFVMLGHRFGGGGTRAGGQAAVGKALERLELDADGLVQVDGSGLSRDSRVTPAQFTGLLVAVLRGLGEGDPAAAAYRDSLALAGRTGTLSTRMRGGPAEGRAYAKTGFLDGTSGLSGTVRTAAGRDLVFSILVNYPSISGLNRTSWKPMQDEMVERLVRGSL